MANKKIDVVVKYFFPVTAGIEVNIMETYSRLAKNGWDVTIHTSSNTYLERGVLPKSETMRGLKVKRYPFKWYGFFPEINYAKADIIALHNFDIFPHMHILLKALVLKLSGKKKFKLVLTPHGGFNPEWSIFSKFQQAVKKNYHYILGNRLINLSVDAVRAVSEWEKEEMIKKGIKGELVSVIDNGIEDEAYKDVDRFASEEIKKHVKSFGRYLIQIGRIYKIKNYETTIQALALLPKDVNFVIAGPVQENDDYIEKINTLIKSLKLQDRVKFIGVVRGIDKYYLIKHAQMMVHMALWESYCNVVHEGLSQGLVCIVADNTALPYLVKDGVNGYCVKTHDFRGVSKRVDFVLKNKNSKFVKDVEERNRKFGLENSWANVSMKLGRLYEDLVKSGLSKSVDLIKINYEKT